MRPPAETDLPGQETVRTKEKETRIGIRTRALTMSILHGTGELESFFTPSDYKKYRDIIVRTGNIGRRLKITSENPHTQEHTQEFLSRVDYGEDNKYKDLFDRIVDFTQKALPEKDFRREDTITPHTRHGERSTLMWQDYLLTTDMPLEEQAVRLLTEYAHDAEEEPQEMLMRNREEHLPDDARGGRTQAQTKTEFDKKMAGLPDDSSTLADKIYDGIHAFNCHNADNYTKFDADYLAGLQERKLEAEKVIDRMDSPQGDLSRIARTVEAVLAIQDPKKRTEKLGTLYDTLTPLYARSVKSINKLRRMSSFVQATPEEIQELWEATVRTGDGFKAAVDELLAENGITLKRPTRRSRFIPARIASLFS